MAQASNINSDMAGGDVRSLQATLATLGFSVAATETKAAAFGKTTAAAVRTLQQELGLHVTGTVDATTAAAFAEAAANAALSYTVTGAVAGERRAVPAGLVIRIVDKSAGPDRVLTETATDANGRYVARFGGDAVRKLGKSLPDLQAYAYAGKVLLGASVVRYNASTPVTLDVPLAADAERHLPAEHDTLTATLATHYTGNLRDLQEGAERRDISFLANKTGWDARAVALAAIADQFSARTKGKVPARYFYALFRAGLPANEDALYRADPQGLAAVWKRAADSGVIADPGSLTATMRYFGDEGARRLLTVPALPGTSSFKDLFAAAGLSAQQQTSVAALRVAHASDDDAFWKETAKLLGVKLTTTLKTCGKLAFLTVNNASLVSKLAKIGDPEALAAAGYHRAEKWAKLIAPSKIPAQIPGDDAATRRANYAAFMAAQLRISYPTAAIGEMLRRGALKIEAAQEVARFLDSNKAEFQLGVQPVARFVAAQGLKDNARVTGQVQRLQRVLQLTPSDDAMSALLDKGYDAAFHIVQKGRGAFVADMAGTLDATVAGQVYARAMQIHGAVLNVAIGYLTAQQSVPLGALQLDGGASGQFLAGAPKVSEQLSASVTAYATLEGLFGSMDYCTCEDCRSILSPAAYMVDLLHFIDRADDGKGNAQAVLFGRRPDLQHLPLTCENTNTALPYIDIVNETLEFFIANAAAPLSLTGYVGHDTGSIDSEELLAAAQFVSDDAYAMLQQAWFPSPLPFDRWIETLRRCFDIFEMPLADVMARLRANDGLEASGGNFGWRAIWMEQLGLSTEEHRILTDSSLTLAQLFGYAGKSDAQVVGALSNAKAFARRTGIDYDTLIALLRTRFVNPNSPLIAKLVQLDVSFATLKALVDGAIADADFLKLLPQDAAAPDPAAFGGDIVAWVKAPANAAALMAIITLANPDSASEQCDFGALELRYSKPVSGPGDTSTRLTAADFRRLLRFIRLWRKTGWTIEQTDAALCALFRADLTPPAAGDTDTPAKLDAGFKTALPRLGVATQALAGLGIDIGKGLQPLLACWAPIGTEGATALYRAMFAADRDPAFADTGHGSLLADTSQHLLDHAEALRGAFNLSGIEFSQITAALNYDATTVLSLATVSAVYRHGWLARALKISVSELLLLIKLTGIDPFAAPDLVPQPAPKPPLAPPILRLIALVQLLRGRGIKSAAALYLIWNQDLSGQSAPSAQQIGDFARSLRADFAGIDDDFATANDPDGDVLRARLTLVYGQESADAFLALVASTIVLDVSYTHGSATLEAAIVATAPALSYDDAGHHLLYAGIMSAAIHDALTGLSGTTPAFQAAIAALYGQGAHTNAVVFDVSYTHPTATLETAITTVAPALGYDNFAHRLSYTGLMTSTVHGALVGLAGMTTAFKRAVDALYAAGADAVVSFALRYPELKPLYDDYVGSSASPAARRDKLLADFAPRMALKRKGEQALTRLSNAAGLDLESARALAAPAGSPGAAALPLHAAADPARPVLDDILGIATQGLAANFYFHDTVAGTPAQHVDAVATVDYPAAQELPANPTAGAAISALWSGSIEIPESGNFNIVVTADAAATITLTLDGQAQPLVRNGTVARNANALAYIAGQMVAIELKAEKVAAAVTLAWETPKRSRQPIPGRYLYPPSALPPFGDAYVRLLKLATLGQALKLTAPELAHFGTDPAYRIGTENWFNLLAVTGNPAAATATALVEPLEALLRFSAIKQEWSPDDTRLLQVLLDPAAAAAAPDGLLFRLSQWDPAALTALLVYFGKAPADLAQFATLFRVHEAFVPITAMGVSATQLLAATTNAPTAAIVRDFQATLKARYAPTDWRAIIKPINDTMRELQRDALVAYILQQFRDGTADQQAIDTPDKLYEYFLFDVEMAACSETSRIRLALSSIQLFIERCLMNLESDVSPASIDAAQWTWRKRYRVWEANRKVFLFPENWLEPELRDQKSPFFKDIESTLLQSDITDDTAGEAVLGYLSKLHDVAHLVPVGMYLEERPPSDGDIVHVIARSDTGSQKYYYRRYEYGYWTPWEEVKLSIEGTPVLPVVWNSRLILFWLKILKQTPQGVPNGSGTASGAIATLTMDGVATAAQGTATNVKVTLQAVLCWSEYYNGKWQPEHSSDVTQALDLGTLSPASAAAFDRDKISLWSDEQLAEGLRITVAMTNNMTAFRLFNTHAQPDKVAPYAAPYGRRRDFSQADGFRIDYRQAIPDIPPTTFTRHPVKDSAKITVVQPNHRVNDPWNAPFFFEDNRNVFYVTSAESPVWVADFTGFGVTPKPSTSYIPDIPPIILYPIPKPGPTPWVVDPIDWGLGDPAAITDFIGDDARIRQGIAVAGNVQLGNVSIGPAGGIAEGVGAGAVVKQQF